MTSTTRAKSLVDCDILHDQSPSDVYGPLMSCLTLAWSWLHWHDAMPAG
jgi:hypothetical protein